MKRIENGITGALEFIITLFFAVICILTILLVVMRYIFNSSITGGNELMEFLFIYTTALGAAIAIGEREHITISYFRDKLKEPLRSLTDILSLLLVAGINLVIAGLSRSWIAKVGFSESPVLRLPMWIIQISVPLGCILAAFYCFSVIINDFRTLKDRIPKK